MNRRSLQNAVAAWVDTQQGRFALWLPICALCGDATYFGLRHQPPGWLGAGVASAGLMLAAVPRLPARAAGLVVLLFGLGFAAAQWATWRAPPFVAFPMKAVMIAGRIIQIDALPAQPGAVAQSLRLDHVAIDGAPIGLRQLRIRADDAASLTTGQTVALRGMVSPPSPPAYPGGRDLQRDAWFDDLAGYGYALGPVHPTGPPGRAWLGALRARIDARVRAVLPGPSGAVAATLLTGSSTAIPQADRAAFRDAGLAHLLAIAGLHIGIVMALALAVTRLILLASERAALFWPVRQIAALAALAAGLGYFLLTGMHLPILRSFVMACLATLALLAGRRAVTLRVWGIACLAVIAIAPAQITGPSFQLSFAAVLALIAGYEVLRAPLIRLRGQAGLGRRSLHQLATLALTSLLAGAASMPFIAYHFGRVQLYFIVANMLAVPLTALWVMPAGLAALILMPVGLDRLALPVMGWGIDGLLRIAHTVAAWPAATLAVADMTLAVLLPMAFGLGWICLWRGRTRLLGTIPILAGTPVAALSTPPDLLISADGRMIGLRAPAAVYVQAAKTNDAYLAAIWSQYLARPVADIATMPDTVAHCVAATCRLRRHGADLDLATDPATLPCRRATLIVVADGAAPYCPGSQWLDRGDSWQQGAWAVWLAPSPRLLSDRDVRGDRPWVYLPPEQQRSRFNLPLAKRDVLAPPR